MLNNIWFNGVSARDMGLKGIEKYPDLNRPERKATIVDVPGRSGSVVFLENAWNNIERQYEIFAGDGQRMTVQTPFRSLSEWLYAPKENKNMWANDHVDTGAYKRLEDTYEPEIFRLAYCVNGFEVENNYTRLGRATITFNCRPERFLKSGGVFQLFDAVNSGTLTGSVSNPTAYASKPVLRVYKHSGADDTTLTITSGGNTYDIELFSPEDYQWYFIDCETMDAVDFYGNNINDYIFCEKFPVFEPNEKTTFAIGAKHDVSIMPRWFYI